MKFFLIFLLMTTLFTVVTIIFVPPELCDKNLKTTLTLMSKISKYYKYEINDNDDIFLTPYNSYNKTLIFLHGMANCAQNFVGKFFLDEKFELPKNVKLIFPQAPKKKLMLNNETMTFWYNLKCWYTDMMNKSQKECFSYEDVEVSKNRILKIINDERKAYKTDKNMNNKIILGGFSQGCATSLSVAFADENNLDSLYCWVGHIFDNVPIQKKNIKMEIYVGKKDVVIPFEFAMKTYQDAGLLSLKNVEIHILEDSNHEMKNEQFNELRKALEQEN